MHPGFHKRVRDVVEERWVGIEVGQCDFFQLQTFTVEVGFNKCDKFTVCVRRGKIFEFIENFTRRFARRLSSTGQREV